MGHHRCPRKQELNGTITNSLFTNDILLCPSDHSVPDKKGNDLKRGPVTRDEGGREGKGMAWLKWKGRVRSWPKCLRNGSIFLLLLRLLLPLSLRKESKRPNFYGKLHKFVNKFAQLQLLCIQWSLLFYWVSEWKGLKEGRKRRRVIYSVAKSNLSLNTNIDFWRFLGSFHENQ